MYSFSLHFLDFVQVENFRNLNKEERNAIVKFIDSI